jgi:RNA polymerase sigma-70 factor (ECF subfamily)
MKQTSSEVEALLRARVGDASAYGLLVQNHQEAAFRAAYLILHDAQAAEDIAQEALVRAYRELHRFREADPFRPWLLRIVTNLALNETRRRRRVFDLLQRFGRQAPRSLPGPEGVLLATEESRDVWRAINQLATDDRLILYLRYFLELSEAEMARVIQRPPGTVKSRLHRAGRRLRAVIEKDYPHLRLPDA